MTRARIFRPSPRDIQVRRLVTRHGLKPGLAALLAEACFGEVIE